jgi:hypothetical protein
MVAYRPYHYIEALRENYLLVHERAKPALNVRNTPVGRSKGIGRRHFSLSNPLAISRVVCMASL